MGKFYEAIMGLVVGDALGVPFEFQHRDSFKAVGMIGYGAHNQPPGTWSDDSSLTIATVDSIATLGTVDLDEIMLNFGKWFSWGKFTPYGKVFDFGRTTSVAIARYACGLPVDQCGCTSIYDNGNGALMRILPMAFYPGSIADVLNVAGLTHKHEISNIACSLYVAIARGLLSVRTKQQAIVEGLERIEHTMEIPKEFDRLNALDSLDRDEIKSTGFVVHTLEAALWCLLKADNYRDTILMAVNLGDDTDTTAAVAGGLAAINYGIGGENGIPEEWIDQVAKQDEIKKLCTRFEERILNR